MKKEIKFHDTLKQQKVKTFETLYTVPVSVDKSKTIAMKADKDLLRGVIVALESGRDVDVNTLLQSELAPVPKSLATLDGSIREAGSRILVPFYKEMSVRAKCPSAGVKHALLLMEWQLFSPSPTLQEQKPLVSGVTDFFVMSLPIFRTVLQGLTCYLTDMSRTR